VQLILWELPSTQADQQPKPAVWLRLDETQRAAVVALLARLMARAARPEEDDDE
jgi:predicted Fe-S protein YdhL (DUF1289 family)